jgi:creatinine amidohydrolase
MHLTPHLVRSMDEAGDGASKKFKFEAIREGWAWAERKWTQVTKDTGVGDPRQASPEKGEKFFDAVTKKIATFFVDVATTNPSDFYA